MDPSRLPHRTRSSWRSVLAIAGLSALACSDLAAADSGSLSCEATSSSSSRISFFSPFVPSALSVPSATLDDRDPRCPPCFNCNLPSFHCLNTGSCRPQDGQCDCPPGFGGLDCGKPLDGSLADGRERYVREGNEAHCKDGWSGLTCNVCETNQACKALIPDDDDTTIRPGFGALVANEAEERDTAVCYKGGYAVDKMHQMCDVTNRKILDMLPDRPPQVTFSCDRSDSTCGFQFWVGGIESFYCGLEECSVKGSSRYDGVNSTQYECGKVECSCIPGRMLCGENGSVNIDDFLSEEIRGPGSFTCQSDGSGCIFTEPAMNQLINDIFGDEYITLTCNSGECLHYTQVPGFEKPQLPDNRMLMRVSIAVGGGLVVLASLLFWYLGRTRKDDFGRIRLSRGSSSLDDDDNQQDELSKLLSQHVSAHLTFSNLSYTTPHGREVLSSVSGHVQPGQLLAIMGASGAGKSTFLDILAKKSKRGSVSGDILVNGRSISSTTYRRMVGFVDQEDTLMSTLTVYETVLYSALLRLPREMPLDAKKLRVLETMHELGILAIKDSRIGTSGARSISGGEKRRVSIACELVTSPSILFLDEPTSGLDAYNAINVIESLKNLAKTYNRTVVFTIHQPRSNIVTMFDNLLLLAGGKVVYSGEYARCQSYFEGIGHPCPQGFNIADFLIDLTMQDERSSSASVSSVDGDATPLAVNGDEESARTVRSPAMPSFPGDTELRSRHKTTPTSSLKGLRSPFSASFFSNGRTSPTATSGSTTLGPQLTRLVDDYAQSEVAADIKTAREEQIARGASASEGGNIDALAGYRSASWWTQFTILSGRAFKNLYRNPMLMLTSYAVSVFVALLCSFLFAHVTNDIPGFQNRMGLFFFVLALFGFSCLTSMDTFASERILFMRERSNGYYSPFTYFTAKVLFDILPLRVIPPFILGAIIYGPVGLVPTVVEFWKFMLVLVLFNLAASSVVFFISIVIANLGVANLVGSLVMLFNLLFAGLLVNRDKVPLGVGWLQTVSFFHAAFEGLLVNEVRYLQLKDHRYGVDIEVPAATILSMFGFRAQAFWWPDFLILCLYFVGFITASFVALLVLVKERR